MNILNEYLNNHQITSANFAKRLGCTEQLVANYRSGRTPVPLDIAFKIEKVTKGEVSARRWNDGR